ncbi:hypothetical protein V6N12_071480 [Hibiscus sabdariffa]|uniref:DUF4220 domain-containing protein n=2 Tax=Hibiscus sabdariffa TaxID=183260 RepID=A0ABR2FJY9_9ROSI
MRFRKSVFHDDERSYQLEVELLQESSRGDLRLEQYLDQRRIDEKYRYLYRAFYLFEVFRPLFSDLKLRIYNNLSYIFELEGKVSAEEAFKIVEIELGFLYDLLYTKIPIVTTRTGVFLRFICLSFTSSTLIAFVFIVGMHRYSKSKVDIGISYLLMVGAIFLEIYSDVLHLGSDRGILWLADQDNKVFKAIGSRAVHFTKPKKGIQSMAQHSLLDYCLHPRKLKLAAILNKFDSDDNTEKYLQTTWKEYTVLSELLNERGLKVLEHAEIDQDFGWSVSKVEFTHSLLLWHIATEVVYNDDHQRFRAGKLGSNCRISKLLSDYMMYLLFLCPAMLPEGIGNIRHQDTCIEAKNFFHNKMDNKQVIRALYGIDIESRSLFVQMGSMRKSAFFEGCQIAVQLQNLLDQFRWDHEEKWEVIANVWLDMLCYAAAQCLWKEHAKQLQHGEELLTHVALLMAHLGLSNKIEMAPLFGRLKDVDFKPSFYWNRLDRLASYLA